MIDQATSIPKGEGRLWAISLGLSVLVNAGLLLGLAVASVRSERLRKQQQAAIGATAAPRVVTIFPDASPANSQNTRPPAATASAPKPRFARTTQDQASAKPDSAALIGERDTTATSDRAPQPDAPELPSQKGRQARDQEDLETTESRYQDGKLSDRSAALPPPPAATVPPAPLRPPADATRIPPPADPLPPSPLADPAMAARPPAGAEAEETKAEVPSQAHPKPKTPPREPLLSGPHPVDVPVPKETEAQPPRRPAPIREPAAGVPDERPAAELPKPTVPAAPARPVNPVRDPAFAGNQQKTAIVGSISRTGRSALNVADTALGRYQAAISRAVELEWQRNCARHRDFITPGYLTVKFYVQPNGKVKTVQFVGQMETGEVQKGFTLNSIRDAAIPPMPAPLRKDYEKVPLELIFNFYF